MMMPSIFRENLFDSLMGELGFPEIDRALYGKNAKNLMKTDIRETDTEYELEMDLPGFKKDEIQMQLDNGYLTVSASKGLDKDESDEAGNYVRRERYAGSMSRTFYIGEDVKQEEIHAKYENGVLKLSIPKEEAKKKMMEEKKYIAIE